MFKKDYKYSINYETEGNSDCKNHGCDDEGICRCFRITDVVISDIDVLYISNSIFSEIFNTKSTQYKRDNKLNQILSMVFIPSKKKHFSMTTLQT